MTQPFSSPSRFFTSLLSPAPIALLALLAATPAQADWPNTNATKWVQLPDTTTNGIDVLCAEVPNAAGNGAPIILADDFLCRQTGPITDIHIWASWLNDTNNCNLPITLCIWTDVPANTNIVPPMPSHPGSRLWCQTFFPGQYSVRPWKTANERFWNPDPFPCGQILGIDHLIWQYNFYPATPFIQQGSATQPVVYWLSMTAGANTQFFGWKTAQRHWNDDAVFGHLDTAGNPIGDWQELLDPKGANGLPCRGRSLDLAFALTTLNVITNPPPPPTNKWVQYPDVNKGLDVNDTSPNILADDFLCTQAGTITNIEVWGSWQDDVAPSPSTTFVLGIWSDVPAGTGGNVSHPGTMLWSETFAPGSYSFAPAGSGNEHFYDPDSGAILPESKIWLYSFTPRSPFCQKGATNSPVVYWLSVRAITQNFRFGWKTSTNHWNDDAVWGHVTSSGTALGDWKDLHDPLNPALVSLDLAFVINNGPPGPACDPNQNPKFIQWPDTSTNGMDVWANYPTVLADDFLCRRPGPISGVSVWGSWDHDLVDTNAVFTLGLWTDVPARPGTTNSYSHPGALVCAETFYPPTAIGTSVLRYKYQLAASNLVEKFYDPDLPGPGGLIGADTQIWRYDFYPRLACWFQRGTPVAPQIYWISLTAATTNGDQFLFGWKTSTNHWNDDAVWGHAGSGNVPPTDWKDLHNPLPPTNSLDLSFALRTFPIVGINKDLTNKTSVVATALQIVVAGIHEVTWTWDDSPPWPVRTVTYSGGNTVITWSGKTIPPGGPTHVGFEMGGTSLTIVSMSWFSGSTVIGSPVQGNLHTWNNGVTLTINNDINPVPMGVLGGTVEYYATPVLLSLMNPSSSRNPIATARLPIQPGILSPGCVMRIPLPLPPPQAQYAMFTVNMLDSQGAPATMDFLQLPLDVAVQPMIQSVDATGGVFTLAWPTIPDRTYRVQSSPDLSANSFFDLFVDLIGDGTDMSVSVPISGAQNFYRILIDPE